jgi:hypothetical protein
MNLGMNTSKPQTVGRQPLTALRIADEEKRELQALARSRGVSLSEAFRRGARLYLTTEVRRD